MSSQKSDRDYLSALKAADCFYIDGRWTPPLSGEYATLIAPGSGRDFIKVGMAGAEDVERAVAAARQAFDAGPWPRMSPADRAQILRRLGAEMAGRAELLGGLQTAEMGALYSMSVGMAPIFAGSFDFYADLASRFAFVEEHPSVFGGVGYLVHEPVGVVAAIVPWNGPLMLACWKLAPALLAGCSVILKASPEAPTALLAFAEAVDAAGVPPGVFNLLTADRDISEQLVRHPEVDKVSFTGSTAAGKRVGAICAERLARCSLELGGKSPAILLDDYDVGTFATAVAQGATILSGQVCAALTRVIVPRARHDAVVEAIKAEFEQVLVGDPFDPAVGMGPLASSRQCARVRGFVDAAIRDGGELVTGGKAPRGLDEAFYIEPTLFANVSNQAAIAREEVFGPVLSILAVDSDAEAIAVANDTPYGLNSAIFTGDADRAFSVARQIRAGTVGHNGFKTDFTIGFGGFKQSGIGREGGIPGLRAFLEPKTVLIDRE